MTKAGETFVSLDLFYSHDPRIVQRALDAGADVNAKDEYGYTPLHQMATMHRGNEEICRLLLERGADPNARDDNGRTPLHWACLYNHTAIVRLLIEHGADAGARDDQGETPFDVALRKHKNGSRRDVILDLFQQFAPELYFSAFCTSNNLL